MDRNLERVRGIPSRFITTDGRIDTERLKAEASIVEIAAEYTDLVRAGSEMKGLCPFHDENTPSLFLNDQKGVWQCFGCSAGGDAITFLRQAGRLDFLDACCELAGTGPRVSPPSPDAASLAVAREANRRRAREEWHRGDPVEGTLANVYLTNRGIGHAVPGSIRFGHPPRFWRDDGRAGPRHPAMIAAAQNSNGRVVGIQRTYLDREGRKSMQGEARLSLGRMRGSALRLGPVCGRIMLASAVEDALSLRSMFPGASVWSAFGDANLAHVELPPEVRHVTLCGDADPPGRAAVAAAGAAFESRGIQVDQLFPKGGAKDFNEEWVLLHA